MTTSSHNPVLNLKDRRSSSSTISPRPPRPIWPRIPYEFELARLGSSRSPADTRPIPLFIVGHARSGTNWTANLLNLHPHIVVSGELYLHNLLAAMPALVSEPHFAGHHEPLRTALARNFQEFVRSSLASLAQTKPGVRFVGDHTPRCLRPILPESPHIIITRDGRDVLISLTIHRLNCQARRALLRYPPVLEIYDHALAMCDSSDESLDHAADWLLTQEPWIRQIARNWNRHILADRDMLDRISRSDFNARTILIRYEDLHANTAEILTTILRFIGVDPALMPSIETDPRCKPGYSQHIASSHYRKGVVGEWHSRLSPKAAEWFISEARPALEYLNYPISSHSPARVNP